MSLHKHQRWFDYYRHWSLIELRDELMSSNFATDQQRTAVVKALIARRERIRKQVMALRRGLSGLS